jgi:hypothetical protein
LLSKVAMASGGIWLLASAIGLVRSELSTTVLAITAALAGVVLGGSNFSTLRRTREAIKVAEALRSQIIDCADLPSVGGTRERKYLQ